MGVIIRQSIKGTVVNYIGVAIGFVTTFFILTKYLTQEEIGLTRMLVDAAVLLSGLAQLGTTSSMMRFFPYFKDENSKNHGIFFWSIMVPFIGFAVFLTVFFICKQWVIDVFSKNSSLFVDYFYFVVPIAFFMLYTSVFEINANLLMRIAVPKFIREVGIRLMLLVSYLLFGFKVISLDGLVIAFCLTYAVAVILNVLYLFSLGKISFKPDFKFLTPHLKRDFAFYTLFLVTAALAGNITPTLNSFFVSAKMGLAYTGIYAIANYIATVIEIPYRSLGAITQPQISQSVKDNDLVLADTLTKKVSLHQFLAGSFIFFAVWINIDLFFQLLPNGNDYVVGKWVVFILSLSRLFNSSFSVGTSVLGYSKYYYMSLVFTFVLTFAAIILNNRLIPIWGMNGAALATLISYVIYYFLLLSLVSIKMKTSPFSWNQLKVVALVLILFLFNFLIVNYITPLFGICSLTGSMIEAIIRTLLLLLIGCWMVYYAKISPEVNQLLHKMVIKFSNH